MRNISIWTALVLFIISNRASANDTIQPPEKYMNYRTPARSYVQTQIGDRKIYIEQSLAQADPELLRKTLTRLKSKLDEALAALPAPTQDEFKSIPFYIMYGPQSPDGGQDNGLAFFKPESPDYHPQLDPHWRNCVVIYSAANYVSISDFWALKALVHELSHAHFAMHYPENQPDLYNCWGNAMNKSLYHNVKDINGKNIEKAWASVNQLEYFAELSCMYFVGCNYYPFNRQQLEAYDPQGFALIKQMWNIQK